MAADKPAATESTTQDANGTPYQLTAEKMMTDNLMILGLLFFIFYFILIRPQQKRAKQHQAMIGNLQKGSKVITNGGLIGSIGIYGTGAHANPILKGVSMHLQKGEVVALLGQPDRIADLGARKIYSYKDIKVTFTNGSVSDVQ